MATNLTNDPTPFTSLTTGATGWDAPLDTWIAAASTDITAVRNTADGAATAAAATVAASRIADGSLPLTKLATTVAPKSETDAIKATADAALAAAGGSTPVRVATAATAVSVADRGGIIHMRNTAGAAVTLPLTGAISPTFPATGATIVGVDRLAAGTVSFAATATGTSLQKIIAPYGVQAMLVGSTMTAELCRPPDATRPTTGLRAVIVGDQFSALADGTAITSVIPDASGSVSLPTVTPSGTQQPTVHRNAAKGHTGIRFNGTTNYLPLTGGWLDLMRNRPSAMIFAVVLVTGTAPTGNRTVVSFLSGNTVTPGARAQLKWRDSGSSQSMALGRRLDSETNSTAANGSAAASPDLSVLGGRFQWATAGVQALRNGSSIGTSAAFGTLGNTQDTPSTAAAIGANGGGTAEFFSGTILEVAIYDDSTAVAAAYEAYAEQQYGEEWLISADGPSA